jgi:hypothetical protein
MPKLSLTTEATIVFIDVKACGGKGEVGEEREARGM